MVFWSKGGSSKSDKVKANKERDIKIKAHLLHMKNSEAMRDDAAKSTAQTEESPSAGEGIDEDFRSKIGAERQKIKEAMHDRGKKLGKMRARVRHSRRRARGRGRSLGL